MPRDVLQFVVCADHEIGRALISDPRMGAVILTGAYETARMFLGWRPAAALRGDEREEFPHRQCAADRDLAIKDLVRSAFGHSGQKCSAASLAIFEAEVYDDPVFRRQLRDAAASLEVGAHRAREPRHAAHRARRRSPRALTALEPGEEWLLEPHQDARPVPVVARHPARCATRFVVPSHGMFGPVLGLMRAAISTKRSNRERIPFGLTAGIHSLDDREVARWRERVEAGNLYINRAITGAIVQRQPFGGWKASSSGPGQKPAAPTTCCSSRAGDPCRASADEDEPPPEALAALLAGCLAALPLRRRADPRPGERRALRARGRRHFSREHDPSAIRGRAKRVPLSTLPPRDRAGNIHDRRTWCQVVLAAGAAQTALTVSLAAGLGRPRLAGASSAAWRLVVEAEAGFVERLGHPETRSACGCGSRSRPRRAPPPTALGVAVIDAPVLANGRLECAASSASRRSRACCTAMAA